MYLSMASEECPWIQEEAGQGKPSLCPRMVPDRNPLPESGRKQERWVFTGCSGVNVCQ